MPYPAIIMMSPLSLSDRLKALGVKVGAQDLPAPNAELVPTNNPFCIENVTPGKLEPTALGEAYIVERYETSYPSTQNRQLWPVSPSLALARWAGDPGLTNLAPSQLAYLDTETSGLAGGVGTYTFMIGIGRFEGENFHLAQFFMRDPSEESAMLLALEEFLAPCQALVTFNGKSFDAPLLNTRYTLQGWRSPLPGMGHFDLLHLARRLYRDLLPNRSLGSLEVQVMGIHRTSEEVPGWMIPQLYFDYLRSGDARPLQGVFYHNAVDILSLGALFCRLNLMLANPLDYSSTQSSSADDPAALGRLFEDMAEEQVAIKLYRRSLDTPISAEHYKDTLLRLARLYKRRGEYNQAIPLWEKAAAALPAAAFAQLNADFFYENTLKAHEELAKVYEHVLDNLPLALNWTEIALALLNDAAQKEHISPGEHFRWQAELLHRQKRLKGKIFLK